MKLYAIVRDGVYRHEIRGIFTDQSEAEGLADTFCLQEDGHHTYEVLEFLANVPVADGEKVYSIDNSDLKRFKMETWLFETKRKLTPPLALRDPTRWRKP